MSVLCVYEYRLSYIVTYKPLNLSRLLGYHNVRVLDRRGGV